MADIHYIEVEDISHVRELMSYSLINPATVCYARDGSLIYISADGQIIPMTGESKNNLIFASSENEMLSLTNVSSGQMVFRTDKEKFYVFIGDAPTDRKNWKTEKNTPIQWGTIKEVI